MFSRLGRLFDRNKTFKPKKKFAKGTRAFSLHKLAKATLGSGDLRAAVVLPAGEELNEWLAVHTIDFYNTTNLLYGSLTEFCTEESCPSMAAGPRYEYLWADGKDYKRPVRVSAPHYVELLMNWINDLVNDDAVFPSDDCSAFPKDFLNVIKKIFKRLFRVYAHIYYSHFAQIQKLGMEAHLNSAFKHFMYFVFEFELIDRKEQEPLEELISSLFS